MARALKNDPSLMFEFVYNNIEHAVGMGLAKGPLATLLDGFGNSFDQCSLLAALLRQAGFVANYEVGQIQLNQTQLNAWLGTTDASNISVPQSLLSNSGVPVSVVGTYPNQQLVLSHCWLKVNIGTVASPNWVVMDPAFKTYTTKSAINLATATGYSQSTFLSQARAGYTIDASGNWVQNLNRANIRTQLQTLTMNLVNWIKTNNPGAGMDDIVGGRQIVPVVAPITFPTSLSYQVVGNVPTEFTGDFSTAYKVTVQFQYPGINVTLTSDQLAGHRLTFFFSPSGTQWVPTLALDGVTVGTGTAQYSGSYYSMLLTVTHNAYPNTNSNQNFYQYFYAPNQGGGTGKEYYLIGTAFGPTGKGSFDYHTALQSQYEFNAGGASETLVAEAPLGERMAAQFASYHAQVTRVTDILNRLTGTLFTNHHTIGLVKYQVYGSPTFSAFDIGGAIGSSSLMAAANSVAAAGMAWGMHGYALEMLAIQQLTGQALGISATRDLDVANSAGTRIYKGTQANWTASVLPNLSGYSSTDLSNIATYYLPYNWDALLPQSTGQTFGGHWTMSGYSLIATYGGALGIIYASYAGGVGPGWWKGRPPKKKKECEESDPVNIRTGDYHYRHHDIKIGSGEYPYALSFDTSYDSRARLVNGPLGLGWTHNWAASATVGSDGFVALGSQSPVSAAASITELYVLLDLLSDATLPVDKLVMCHIANQWWVDQLTNNVVTVSMPDDQDLEFVLMPDGTYSPPSGSASALSLTAGAYTVTTPQKVKYNFNTSGQLASIVYPYGVTITLTYTSGKLTSVSNGLGRTLTLGYTGNFITSVSDGTGRSVGYTIDGSNQLTKFTDALSQAYTFSYVSAGLMQKYFKPQNPANAVVTNTFDSLNRVQSQLDILGHTISFYLAGSRSEIVDPVGNRSIAYYDPFGNQAKSIDALGNQVVLAFDGLGRLSQTTRPELNYKTWVYDAQNNVLTETRVAKPGSGLANIVVHNTYDPAWNKVKTAQDGRGNTTVNTYDPSTGNLLTVQRPVISGQTPTVTMKWNSRGQLLSLIDETGIQTQWTYDSATEKLLSKLVNTNWTCTIGGAVTVGNVLTITVHDSALSGGVKSDSYTVVTSDTLAKIATGLANAINADSALASIGVVAYVNGSVLSLSTSPGNTTTFTGSTSGGATETLTFVAGMNLTENYGYDSVGNVNSIQDARGNSTTFLSDALRRLTTKTEPSPFSYVTQYGYDKNDNLLTLQRQTGGTPAWQTFTWTYTLSDKKQTLTDPNTTNVTTWFYDAADRLQKVQDAENRLYQYSYDALNRVYTVTDPTTVISETRGYSPNGKLNSIKDARNFTTGFTFDGFDRPDKTNYPDGTFEENQVYDANGNVLTYRMRSGNTVVRTFDVLNRVATKAPQSEATVTYVYDLTGRLLSATTPVVSGDPSTGAFQRIYDSAGRFTKEVYPDSKTVTLTLDQNANLTRIQYPDGYYVDRAYDQLNRLATIKLNGATTAAATFGYNQLSQKTSLALSSGASVAYSPQLNEDITNITHTFVGSNLSLGQGSNKVHQVTSQTISDSTYSWHPGAASTVAYATASNTNEYPQVGSPSYSYNASGCLTGDGTWTHGFDTENHLISSSKTGTSLVYVYDPFHRQAQKAVTTSGTVKTRYIYSGWQRLADYDGTAGTLQNRYVYGIGLDEPLIQVSSAGVLTFLHANYQGSIIATTNSAGAVTNKNKFGPFGETATLAGTSFGFLAQRFDAETGLYYFKNRYYSPALGRFIQPDPAGYEIEVECGCTCKGGCGDDATPSILNLYSYVENDPLNKVDILGLQSATVVGTAVAPGPGTAVGALVDTVIIVGTIVVAVGTGTTLANAAEPYWRRLLRAICRARAFNDLNDCLDSVNETPCSPEEAEADREICWGIYSIQVSRC
jgi:RHS repeat-associated protein